MSAIECARGVSGGGGRRIATSSLVSPLTDRRGVVPDVPERLAVLIPLVDEQPVLPGLVFLAGPHQHEAALQPLPVERELELAVLYRGSRLIQALRLPRALVPDDDVSATVLTDRDDALEIEVLDGVVFRPGCAAFGERAHRRPTRQGPADQDAADLEAEVIVQS